MCVACVLVEHQAAGLEVDRIFQVRGRGLVGIQQALRIRPQINLDFALGGDVSGRLIVFEIGATDLIEAAGIASVESDLDIVQLGVSALLELHRFAGLDGEQGASLLRFRDGESGRALLDFEADLFRNLLERVLDVMTRIEICSRNREHGDDRGAGKPAAQAG